MLRFAQTSNSQLRVCFLCVAYSNEGHSGSSSKYTALWKGLGVNKHHCTRETCMNSQARQGFGVISCTGPIESKHQAFGPAVIVCFVGGESKSDLCFCTASGHTNETCHLGEIKQAPPKVIIPKPWLFLYNREPLCNGNEMIYTPKFWAQHLESLIRKQVEPPPTSKQCCADVFVFAVRKGSRVTFSQ